MTRKKRMNIRRTYQQKKMEKIVTRYAAFINPEDQYLDVTNATIGYMSHVHSPLTRFSVSFV